MTLSDALSDLLDLTSGSETNNGSVERELREIPIDAVSPNEFQPRKEFDSDALDSLALSIAELGVLQPILVRPSSDDTYELIAGERRWRAAQQAGISTIPAVVGDFKDRDSLEQAIVENLHRSDLNPLEEAEAYQRLVEQFDLTHAEVGKRMGKSRPAIVNSIRLLSLPDAILALVRSGALGAGHARTIITVEDPETQLELANKAVLQNLSVRALENLVRALHKPLPSSGTSRTGSNYGHLEVEDRLEEYLETQVKVNSKGGRGQIAIEFADTVDLARVYELIIPRSSPK